MKINNLLLFICLLICVAACEAPQETQTVSQEDSEAIDSDWTSFLQLFPTKSLPLVYPDTAIEAFEGLKSRATSIEERIILTQVKKYVLPYLPSENPLKSAFMSDEKAFEKSYQSFIVFWESFPVSTGFYPEAIYQKDGNIFLTIASLQTSGSGDGFGRVYQLLSFCLRSKR